MIEYEFWESVLPHSRCLKIVVLQNYSTSFQFWVAGVSICCLAGTECSIRNLLYILKTGTVLALKHISSLAQFHFPSYLPTVWLTRRRGTIWQTSDIIYTAHLIEMVLCHFKQAEWFEVTSVSIRILQPDTCLNFSEDRELCYLAFSGHKLEPHASEHLQEVMFQCGPPDTDWKPAHLYFYKTCMSVRW